MDPVSARVVGMARRQIQSTQLRKRLLTTVLADSRGLLEHSRELIRISKALRALPRSCVLPPRAVKWRGRSGIRALNRDARCVFCASGEWPL